VTTQQQIIDDDDVKAERQVPKKDIQAANYSKKVQEAMEQEDDTANAGNADQQQEEEPTTKYQMGNLRKNKRESTQVIKGSTSGEITDKELEMLKGMIQNICQNSTPLGKSIEFINDDIESMNQELLSWRKQYNVMVLFDLGIQSQNAKRTETQRGRPGAPIRQAGRNRRADQGPEGQDPEHEDSDHQEPVDDQVAALLSCHNEVMTSIANSVHLFFMCSRTA
jgi:hypothetical protein